MPLTPAELEVVSLLAQAEAAFRALPERMPSDDEFGLFVHALQHRVMARAALREHADTFAPLAGVLPETPQFGYAGDGLPPGWRAVNEPPAEAEAERPVLDLGRLEADGDEPDDLDDEYVPVSHGRLSGD